MKKTMLTLAALSLLTAATARGETLLLADALKMAAAANRSLKVSAFDEQLAAESVRISRSGFLPRIDLQGGYTAQQAPQAVSLQQGSFETQQADYGFFSLGIAQTLYDFGRTASRTSRAEAGREAAGLAYRSREQETFLQVVTAYFRILREMKLGKAASEEVAQMEEHRRVAQSLFDEGVVTRNDLLQAQVRLASSRQRQLETSNQVTNAWLRFNHLIEAPAGHRAELREETVIPRPDEATPAEEAVARRAEILAQHKAVEESEYEVAETRTGFFPELYARLGVDYVQNDKVREQAIMAATVGFRVNLFDGYATTARFRQAVQNRSRATEQLRQLEAELALEYRTAMNDARVAAERITVTQESIRQGEENLRINRDRYQEQVGTATDVIDAQTLLTQIKTENYQALYDYQVALARVKRARGEL